MENKEDNIDYNKVLNSKCICSIGLPWKEDTIIMAYPCEHMYHSSCYNKLENNICKFCNIAIEKKLTMFDKDLHHQRFSDILSVSYYDNMSSNTPLKFLDSVFDIINVLVKLPFVKSQKEGKIIAEEILSINNLTLKVYGLEKIKKEKNKVYICNHVSQYELIIIYYLLGTGFLSTANLKNVNLIEQLKRVVSMLMVDRGNKNREYNIVDEMRKFVDENGSICIFPEGMMKHPDALVRFRSGAFHINRPIYAITIRHHDIISDNIINNFLYKLGAKRDINMEVHILGPYYPPFTDNYIQQIRNDMAKHGNFLLSRVSNRDVRDT